jgi:predicted phosphodiesterase
MNNKVQSKWIEVFKDNPQQENESQSAYLRKLAKEYGVGDGTVRRAYHTHVTRKKQEPTFNPETPTFKQLPKSDAKDPVIADIKGKKVLILSDIHVPYHDVAAIHCAVNEGIRQKCDTIILNGDFMDCHEISRFEKDKFKRTFVQEVQLTKQLFSWLRYKFPKALIYNKLGNHEVRYKAYLRKNASALEGLESFELENILDYEKFGVISVGGNVRMRFNELSIIHGHEYGGSVFSPVNVARGLYTRAKASAMCGHSHVTSEHTEVDITGKLTTCWSVGCLSELRPDYAPFSKYNQGFAIVSRKGSTGFHVQNFRILDGKIL